MSRLDEASSPLPEPSPEELPSPEFSGVEELFDPEDESSSDPQAASTETTINDNDICLSNDKTLCDTIFNTREL